MKNLRLNVLLLSLFCASFSFAQRGRGHAHEGHRRNVVVIRKSPYRPSRVVVYHPYWRPAYTCHRRWVFFPAYNLYWDNWRNHYVFLNGTVWVSQPAAPPALINVNLEKEKAVQLKEDEDDVDDIYKSNSQHKTEYKNG